MLKCSLWSHKWVISLTWWCTKRWWMWHYSTLANGMHCNTLLDDWCKQPLSFASQNHECHNRFGTNRYITSFIVRVQQLQHILRPIYGSVSKCCHNYPVGVCSADLAHRGCHCSLHAPLLKCNCMWETQECKNCDWSAWPLCISSHMFQLISTNREDSNNIIHFIYTAPFKPLKGTLYWGQNPK